MKPDKIYIQPDAHDRWWEGDSPNENFSEYISKQLLMDWVEEFMKEHGAIAFETLINKLNSL